jgi:hypothetical protein
MQQQQNLSLVLIQYQLSLYSFLPISKVIINKLITIKVWLVYECLAYFIRHLAITLFSTIKY